MGWLCAISELTLRLDLTLPYSFPASPSASVTPSTPLGPLSSSEQFLLVCGWSSCGFGQYSVPESKLRLLFRTTSCPSIYGGISFVTLLMEDGRYFNTLSFPKVEAILFDGPLDMYVPHWRSHSLIAYRTV